MAIILKQVIHYPETNSVEATWVDRTIAPDTVDEEGNIVAGAVTDIQVRCHSYADVQMEQFIADLGYEAPEFAELIALVESNIQPAPPTYIAPLVISPRQIRQALTATGLRAAVEAAVAAGNQDLKDWWEFATAFEENHAMVVGMASGLGVSAEQLHSLFELGASL